MDAKTKSPLWIIVIGCAFYITKFLIFNQYLIEAPVFVLIFIFDLIIILSSMVPQATVDECKKYWEWMVRLPFAASLLIVAGSLGVSLINYSKIVSRMCPNFNTVQLAKIDNFPE